MVDGFVQQYKDGGWISRWSSPGYANLMIGTSSDVAFADAYVKGVRNFDVKAAYDGGGEERHGHPAGATRTTPASAARGWQTSIFQGYTPIDAPARACPGRSTATSTTSASRTWPRRSPRTRPRRRPTGPATAEESEYFRNRAQNYVNMFDPTVELLPGQGRRRRTGSPARRSTTRGCGARHDYTETNGWNIAFHVPQDGQGLANLYGGRDGLADKLDKFFATPETATFPGSYGGTIHEMTEARDVRMGQWGHSNQPSHHIPYMYDYAGQPSKTQEKVREALSRLYLGSEIGQGYPATRTTARCPPGRCSARSASTRCRWAAPTTRSARRCSPRRR